jgi:hypothetical protein
VDKTPPCPAARSLRSGVTPPEEQTPLAPVAWAPAPPAAPDAAGLHPAPALSARFPRCVQWSPLHPTAPPGSLGHDLHGAHATQKAVDVPSAGDSALLILARSSAPRPTRLRPRWRRLTHACRKDTLLWRSSGNAASPRGGRHAIRRNFREADRAGHGGWRRGYSASSDAGRACGAPARWHWGSVPRFTAPSRMPSGGAPGGAPAHRARSREPPRPPHRRCCASGSRSVRVSGPARAGLCAGGDARVGEVGEHAVEAGSEVEEVLRDGIGVVEAGEVLLLVAVGVAVHEQARLACVGDQVGGRDRVHVGPGRGSLRGRLPAWSCCRARPCAPRPAASTGRCHRRRP